MGAGGNVQYSRFPRIPQPELVLEEPEKPSLWCHLPSNPSACSGCDDLLALSIPKPFARRIRIQSCCHCWFPTYPITCLDQHQSPPSVNSSLCLLGLQSPLFSVLHPNTLPFLPKISILPLLDQKILVYFIFGIALQSITDTITPTTSIY